MASASVDGAPVSQQAQAKVNGIVQQDAAKGRVPIHTFDPNSSPESKGAAAGKGEDKLGLENADVQTGAKGMPAAQPLHLPHGRSKAVPLTYICPQNWLWTRAPRTRVSSRPSPSKTLTGVELSTETE